MHRHTVYIYEEEENPSPIILYGVSCLLYTNVNVLDLARFLEPMVIRLQKRKPYPAGGDMQFIKILESFI